MSRGVLPRVRCFAAHPGELSEAREFVRRRAVDDRVPPDITEELVLAVSEAFSNAVDHSDSMLVLVSWQAGNRDVEVQVKDDGVFHDRLAVASDRGYGMSLMMAMVDELAIRRGTDESPGTLVRLRKNVGRAIGSVELVVLSGGEDSPSAREGRRPA